MHTIVERLVLPALIAAAAGAIGSFAVMRRMALAADALSHVALPGIGIAIALHLHPLIGAGAMLFFGALLVWALEDRTRLATETIVGVLFSGALAVGSLMSSGEDLLDALLGRPAELSWGEAGFAAAGAVLILLVIFRQRDRLVITLVSPDIARTAGVNVRRLDLIYLQIFALAVALGLRYLGVLLMGSLLIIPAATAKRLSIGLSPMLWTAMTISVAVTVVGSAIAASLHRESGPIIVTLAAATFLVSLVKR
jgi:ABC-type Mn2+/Zn2+ transport system permease subunit